jgi:hypothetical protein
MIGCSSDTPTNPYIGRDLNVGVIGGFPDILESKRVTLHAVDFEDLIRGSHKKYDAVFVMKERLAGAADDQYSEVYSRLGLPIIFIGTSAVYPFTSTDIEYQPEEYQQGTSYAVGIVNGTEYGWGLYNDEESEETVNLFYSDLFRLIEKSTNAK